MARVEARAFEQLGEVHHGRVLSPRASRGITTCAKCWLEAIANDSAKQAVGGRSMVRSTGRFHHASQECLSAAPSGRGCRS